LFYISPTSDFSSDILQTFLLRTKLRTFFSEDIRQHKSSDETSDFLLNKFLGKGGNFFEYY
jgi:hypothetical protein